MSISKSGEGIHARIVGALLEWFAVNARKLPWRGTQDPYPIWVSEIMLQQTQVKTVIPYWERWMRELPTIHDLADAPPDRVLKLWEGLGYYTRSRNLQKAARAIVEQHGGRFPTRFEAVLALPGIGRYTAGAICSIAHNQPTPILDGNVIRVLTRLFAITGNPREKRTNDRLWQLAQDLVAAAAVLEAQSMTQKPNSRVPPVCSHLNQSLMELGALVCTARQPQCPQCPLSTLCRARRRGITESLPNLAPPVAPSARRFFVFVLSQRGRLFVRRRPAGVVNAHLWEFPNVEVDSGSVTPAQMFRQQFRTRPRALAPLCLFRHSITRFRISVAAFHEEVARRPADLCGRWLAPGQLDALAFTSAHRKIFLQYLRGQSIVL